MHTLAAHAFVVGCWKGKAVPAGAPVASVSTGVPDVSTGVPDVSPGVAVSTGVVFH